MQSDQFICHLFCHSDWSRNADPNLGPLLVEVRCFRRSLHSQHDGVQSRIPKLTGIKFCVRVDISDVVKCTNFGDNQLTGFRNREGQISPFSIGSCGRPQNTQAAVCCMCNVHNNTITTHKLVGSAGNYNALVIRKVHKCKRCMLSGTYIMTKIWLSRAKQSKNRS